VFGGALTIEFVVRVRGEMTFESDSALRAQIAGDVDKIRAIVGISP
jgi:FAD synthase